MIPTVVMVGADKGGVGKTTVTRALADYLAERKVAATFFDSQFPAGNLCRFAPATVIDISTVRDQMKVFDAITGVTVLDVCAGLLSPTVRALDQAGLLKEVRAGELTLVLLHVLGESVASLSEIAATAQAIGDGARHYLVKNHINKGGFAEWESDPRFAAHFAQMASRTISIPYLDVDVYRQVEKEGISFSAFDADRNRSRIQRGYVRDWLANTFGEFDRVGLKELLAAQ